MHIYTYTHIYIHIYTIIYIHYGSTPVHYSVLLTPDWMRQYDRQFFSKVSSIQWLYRNFIRRLPFFGGMLIGVFAYWARQALDETHSPRCVCVAVCCCVLQCVAVCCGVIYFVAVYCNVLQCVAVCCSVLQCGAVYCSVLQCVAVCRSVLQCVKLCVAAVCYIVLQCVAVCCSVLQCVAVCFSVTSLSHVTCMCCSV